MGFACLNVDDHFAGTSNSAVQNYLMCSLLENTEEIILAVTFFSRAVNRKAYRKKAISVCILKSALKTLQVKLIYAIWTKAPQNLCLHFLILHILRIIPKEQ